MNVYFCIHSYKGIMPAPRSTFRRFPSRTKKYPARRSANVARFATRRQYGANTYKNQFSRPLRTLQPNTMKLVLRYAMNGGESHELASTTGAVVDYVYRANGLYDPYTGAGGAQPRGFDQYMALYRQFTVIGAKANMRFWYQDNAGASGGVNETFKCAVILKDSSTAISSVSEVAESNHANVKLLVGGTQPCRISKGFSTRKYMSRPNPLDDSRLSGTASSDPADQSYFHVCAFAMNSQTSTCYVDGWIDYIVIFHGPFVPASS